MSDRIKFRVWDIEDCTYFEPRDFDDLWLNENAELRVGFYSDATQMIEDYTDNVIIEQCTGLKDKNGNLIYEGDVLLCDRKIVDCGTGEEIHYKKSGVVQRDKNGQYFINGKDWYGSDITFYNECAEIIGNIHEQA